MSKEFILSSPIISVKEARRLIGKDLSDKLDDSDLAVIINWFYNLASVLLTTYSVPQNDEVL